MPIDCDAHFKYICPNPKCSLQHWQSLNQVSVKNYKIVCDCGSILKTKQIKSIKIEYVEDPITVSQKEKITTDSNIQEIDNDLLDKSVKVLITYGFTKQEAISMIKDSYSQNPTTEFSILVKNTLESFGTKYVNSNSSV